MHWRRMAVILFIVGITMGGDQLTKEWAIRELKPSAPRLFLNDAFRLQYAENPGAFLSLGASMTPQARQWLFGGGVGLILFGLLIFVMRTPRLSPTQVTAFSLILGGGLSNWFDRLVREGVVVDFMNAGIGPLRTGIFNVADLAIDAGVVLILIHWIREKRQPAVSSSPI